MGWSGTLIRSLSRLPLAKSVSQVPHVLKSSGLSIQTVELGSIPVSGLAHENTVFGAHEDIYGIHRTQKQRVVGNRSVKRFPRQLHTHDVGLGVRAIGGGVGAIVVVVVRVGIGIILGCVSHVTLKS